jgi:hypothetical protein
VQQEAQAGGLSSESEQSIAVGRFYTLLSRCLGRLAVAKKAFARAAPGTPSVPTGGSPVSVSDYEERAATALRPVYDVQISLNSDIKDPARWEQAATVLRDAGRKFQQLVPPPEYTGLNAELSSVLGSMATAAAKISADLRKGDPAAAQAGMNQYKDGLVFAVAAIFKFHVVKG